MSLSVYGTNGLAGIGTTSRELPEGLQSPPVADPPKPKMQISLNGAVLVGVNDSELYSATTSRVLAELKPVVASGVNEVSWSSTRKPFTAHVVFVIGQSKILKFW